MNLDEYVLPVAMVVIGYPTEQQKNRKKPARFEREYLVHENQYRKLTPDEHREMFIKRASVKDFDYEDFMDKFCSRKYMSSFSKEMTRSTEVYLKPFLNHPVEEQEK